MALHESASTNRFSSDVATRVAKSLGANPQGWWRVASRESRFTLAAIGQLSRLHEFVGCIVICGVAATLISSALPALGAHHFHLIDMIGGAALTVASLWFWRRCVAAPVQA